MADTLPVRSESIYGSEELNPLLNPVLEQNLSRWAQVYFTAPPEARDQAVRDLLRQLHVDVHPGVPPPVPAQAATVPGTSIFCPNCRRENTPDEQFCGFCGTPLEREAAEVTAPRPRTVPAQDQPHVETLSFLGLDSNQAENDLDFLRERSFGSQYYDPDSEPSHRRRYVIAVIALILAGLTYAKWPFVQSHLRSFIGPAPAMGPALSVQAPAAPGTGAPQTVTPTATEPTQSAGNRAQPQAGSPPKSLAVEPEPSPQVETAREKSEDAGRLAQPVRPLALTSQREASDTTEGGTQELLQAQRYLDGRGVAHDSRQAAALLWKAVSKQNTRADVLLADLYLRGNGVPKSCDQARILLVAAAKKGAPGVTERLRSLESNGCR